MGNIDMPDYEEQREARAVARERVRRAIRALLENDPPFKRVPFELSEATELSRLDELAPKSLTLACSCSPDPTTWKPPETFAREAVQDTSRWEAHRIWVYRCTDCEKRASVFWVAFRSTKNETLPGRVTQGGNRDATSAGTIEKVTQWPRWTVRIPKRVEKAFGEKVVLLQRAIHCLQEGYGIGAAAYLRRLVEDEARAIVELVRDAARLDGDQEALRNADEALSHESASKRLEIAAKRIPPSLRVDSGNPLEVLYGSLSGPLHSETEDEAVVVASMLVEALLFVFEGLKQRVDERQRFAETIRSASQRLAATKRGTEE
jgi:hypothetical protein